MNGDSSDFHEDLHRGHAEETSSDRNFGLVLGGVAALYGLLPLKSGHEPRWWALAVGILLIAIAFAAPGILRVPNRLWTKLGLILQRIINPIVMGLLFFAVVTPVGKLMRLSGGDPLRLRRDPAAKSYWIVRTPPGPAPDSIVNQF